MLDFYLLEDARPKPGYPEQDGLKFVLGLDLETFHNLVNTGAIDPRFDYFSDFRWREQVVRQMYDRLVEAPNKTAAIDRLVDALAKAMVSKCGIVAYCD